MVSNDDHSRVNSWIGKAIQILRKSRRILEEAPNDLKYRINAIIALLKPIALIKTRNLDVEYPDIMEALETCYNKLLGDIYKKADAYRVRSKIRELLKYLADEERRMLIAIAVG